MAAQYFPTNNYLFKVNNRSKILIIKTPCSSESFVEQVIIGGVICFKQVVLYVL